MTTYSIQYTKGQAQMRKCALCLIGVVGVLFVAGIVLLYNSTAYTYQAAQLDQSSKNLSGEIAVLESAYKEQTSHFDEGTYTHQRMVRYSPGSDSVRYAQVGGSVYSMLSHSNL